MRKLGLDDIKDLVAYERGREAFRRRIIELKDRRRVALGDRISLVFENRETVLSQIQEMTRAERLVDPDKVQFEIDTYNNLIPDEGDLSATLFIEITDEADIRGELDRLLGLDRDDVVSFEIEGHGRAGGRFEQGHSNESRISAVHYVRFPFTREQREAFVEGRASVALVVNHPSYRASTVLSAEVRRALAEDFA